MKLQLSELKKFRQYLHQNPELSNQEKSTAELICKKLRKFAPDKIIRNLGGNGLAAFFKGKKNGKKILLRCELDALPLYEKNDVSYRSSKENIAHLCGHDGHMAILLGVAEKLAKNRSSKGTVILLFQPAEETGEGAEKILQEDKFQKINPDFVFALHNLPGYPKNSIVIRKNIFASASKGLEIKIFGKTAHAAEPEKGKTPVLAVSEILEKLSLLGKNPFIQTIQKNSSNDFQNFTLLTIIHALVGNIAYGTTPGYAEIRATLRSYQENDLQKLSEKALEIIRKVSKKNKLEFSFAWKEKFPNTKNDWDATKKVIDSAEKLHLDLIRPENPFRWSEDFGHFTHKFKGALFGLGAGKDHPELHHPNYDFPDEIIETGIQIFGQIIQNTLEK